jgi:hypothetical protein
LSLNTIEMDKLRPNSIEVCLHFSLCNVGL